MTRHTSEKRNQKKWNINIHHRKSNEMKNKWLVVWLALLFFSLSSRSFTFFFSVVSFFASSVGIYGHISGARAALSHQLFSIVCYLVIGYYGAKMSTRHHIKTGLLYWLFHWNRVCVCLCLCTNRRLSTSISFSLRCVSFDQTNSSIINNSE